MKSPGIKKIRWVLKPMVHGLSLIPFVMMVFGLINHTLGPNPAETLSHVSGEWGLRFLLITLTVTPLVRLTKSGWITGFRRLLGLYCFFYVFVHFLIYLILDLSLDFGFLAEDIFDRPYITVGFLGLVILAMLAITSPISIRQKMGRDWDSLHQFIYLAGILGIVHFLWITKADDTEPMMYGFVFLLLIGWRLVRKIGKNTSRPLT
ncbi:MAG: sulfoxide reductase heme-binding subunit YedZ [Gammaproteobacteria bacterium]|nr:sulfoxide reductase heme-binding subunit YedZ [Gammaproteobacteria bacterium]